MGAERMFSRGMSMKCESHSFPSEYTLRHGSIINIMHAAVLQPVLVRPRFEFYECIQCQLEMQS